MVEAAASCSNWDYVDRITVWGNQLAKKETYRVSVWLKPELRRVVRRVWTLKSNRTSVYGSLKYFQTVLHNFLVMAYRLTYRATLLWHIHSNQTLYCKITEDYNESWLPFGCWLISWSLHNTSLKQCQDVKICLENTHSPQRQLSDLLN